MGVLNFRRKEWSKCERPLRVIALRSTERCGGQQLRIWDNPDETTQFYVSNDWQTAAEELPREYDDHEHAEHVTNVLTAAIAGRQGMQVITDQGTPYMAKVTRDALEQLGAEHAPQREGDPPGKATVERGFGILKTIAAPLFALSDRAASVVPALCNVELARR